MVSFRILYSPVFVSSIPSSSFSFQHSFLHVTKVFMLFFLFALLFSRQTIIATAASTNNPLLLNNDDDGFDFLSFLSSASESLEDVASLYKPLTKPTSHFTSFNQNTSVKSCLSSSSNDTNKQAFASIERRSSQWREHPTTNFSYLCDPLSLGPGYLVFKTPPHSSFNPSNFSNTVVLQIGESVYSKDLRYSGNIVIVPSSLRINSTLNNTNITNSTSTNLNTKRSTVPILPKLVKFKLFSRNTLVKQFRPPHSIRFKLARQAHQKKQERIQNLQHSPQLKRLFVGPNHLQPSQHTNHLANTHFKRSMPIIHHAKTRVQPVNAINATFMLSCLGGQTTVIQQSLHRFKKKLNHSFNSSHLHHLSTSPGENNKTIYFYKSIWGFVQLVHDSNYTSNAIASNITSSAWLQSPSSSSISSTSSTTPSSTSTSSSVPSESKISDVDASLQALVNDQTQNIPTFLQSVIPTTLILASSFTIVCVMLLAILCSSRLSEWPRLQLLSLLLCVITMAITMGLITRNLQAQAIKGYFSGPELTIEIESSLLLSILFLLCGILTRFAQVQVLLGIYKRPVESRVIFWLGTVLNLTHATLYVVFLCYSGTSNTNVVRGDGNALSLGLDTNSSSLNSTSYATESSRLEASSLYVDEETLAAFEYLFKISMSLLYCCCICAYCIIQRKVAFCTRELTVIGILSLVSIFIPVALFILDVSNSSIGMVGNWLDYVDLVALLGSTVVVREWVMRVRRQDMKRQGESVLGRQIYSSDQNVFLCTRNSSSNSNSHRKSQGGIECSSCGSSQGAMMCCDKMPKVSRTKSNGSRVSGSTVRYLPNGGEQMKRDGSLDSTDNGPSSSSSNDTTLLSSDTFQNQHQTQHQVQQQQASQHQIQLAQTVQQQQHHENSIAASIYYYGKPNTAPVSGYGQKSPATCYDAKNSDPVNEKPAHSRLLSFPTLSIRSRSTPVSIISATVYQNRTMRPQHDSTLDSQSEGDHLLEHHFGTNKHNCLKEDMFLDLEKQQQPYLCSACRNLRSPEAGYSTCLKKDMVDENSQEVQYEKVVGPKSLWNWLMMIPLDQRAKDKSIEFEKCDGGHIEDDDEEEEEEEIGIGIGGGGKRDNIDKRQIVVDMEMGIGNSVDHESKSNKKHEKVSNSLFYFIKTIQHFSKFGQNVKEVFIRPDTTSSSEASYQVVQLESLQMLPKQKASYNEGFSVHRQSSVVSGEERHNSVVYDDAYQSNASNCDLTHDPLNAAHSSHQLNRNPRQLPETSPQLNSNRLPSVVHPFPMAVTTLQPSFLENSVPISGNYNAECTSGDFPGLGNIGATNENARSNKDSSIFDDYEMNDKNYLNYQEVKEDNEDKDDFYQGMKMEQHIYNQQLLQMVHSLFSTKAQPNRPSVQNPNSHQAHQPNLSRINSLLTSHDIQPSLFKDSQIEHSKMKRFVYTRKYGSVSAKGSKK